MFSDYPIIKIKFIPAVFPAIDFEDTLIAQTRVVKMPENRVEISQTDKKYATVNNRNYTDNQIIQSIVYNRYTLEVYFTENIEIDNIKIADNIEVFTTDGEIFNAKVINLSYDKPDGNGTINKLTFEFYKIQNDSKSINNYLTSDFLLQRYSENNLYVIEFSNNKNIDTETDFENGETFKIYTSLVPYISRSELIIKEMTLGDETKIISNSTDWKIYKIRFYLNETEMLKFKKYAKRCFYFENFITLGTKLINVDTLLYLNAVEAIEYELTESENLINIYQLDVHFKTDLINYYHFV